jgi:hypothetical protein
MIKLIIHSKFSFFRVDDMSDYNFWYEHWPKVGLITAIFLLLMLFLNSKAPIGSFEWLYWLSLPLYMIHQVEEYIFPGGFKEEMNKILFRGNASREIITDKVILIINVGFIWILTPVLIVLGSISVIFPVILMTLVTFNGFIHVAASVLYKRYNPGLVVSLIVNIPLGLYVLFGLGLNAVASSMELLIGILIGVALHVILLVSLSIRARKYTNIIKS